MKLKKKITNFLTNIPRGQAAAAMNRVKAKQTASVLKDKAKLSPRASTLNNSVLVAKTGPAMIGRPPKNVMAKKKGY